MPDNPSAMPAEASPEEVERHIKLETIFLPVLRQRRDYIYGRDPQTGALSASPKFVHYTSAEAALSIIKNKRLWMRNAMSMSDYREVLHGYEIVQSFFNDKSKLGDFVTALDRSAPDAAIDAINMFKHHWESLRFHTYIASISEHLPKENLHGRLSMWRAFGGHTARVGLVFNIPWNSSGTTALALLFSPVAYLKEAEFHDSLYEVIANINTHGDFLRSLDRSVVIANVFLMLLAGVTCLKHEGFQEEREWRAIYSPHIMFSELMEATTRVIAGVPQTIYSIPLDQRVSSALSSLELSRIFDRLIIGPSQYSLPMYDAFIAALIQAGVPPEVAYEQVQISGIPIRA